MIRIKHIATMLRNIISLSVIAMLISGCATTAPETDERSPFTFVQMCDTQLGLGGYEATLRNFSNAVAQINGLSPDFVVICGDLVGRPERTGYADFNDIKAKLKAPCYCVPGNHDVDNQPTPDTLANYRKSIGKDYYALRHNGYVFLFVNSQLWKAPLEGESQKQDNWLKKELESAVKDHSPVLIVGHHPLFAKSPDEAEEYGNLPVLKRKELLALFERSGVVAVITGHAHKIIANEFGGMQLVTGETTSTTHGSPLGFRIWRIKEPRPFLHESVLLENRNAETKAQ